MQSKIADRIGRNTIIELDVDRFDQRSANVETRRIDYGNDAAGITFRTVGVRQRRADDADLSEQLADRPGRCDTQPGRDPTVPDARDSGRGRRVELRLDATAFGNRRCEILVRATVQTENGRVTRVVPLVLNDAPEPTRGVRRRNSRGEDILEFTE